MYTVRNHSTVVLQDGFRALSSGEHLASVTRWPSSGSRR